MCLAQYLKHSKWLVNVAMVIGIPAGRTELLSPACEGGVQAPNDEASSVSVGPYSASHRTEPQAQCPHLPRWPFLLAARPSLWCLFFFAGAGALVLSLFYQQPVAKQPGQCLHQLPPALRLLRVFLW